MARFEPVEIVIDELCLISGDLMRRKKGVYLAVANTVWNDLNETTLRIAKRLKIPIRKKYEVNKRTNSIELPCNFNRLSSVNVVDERGVIHPVYRNLSIHDDILDVPAEKNCACENKCGYNLCNTIKGYVAVQTTVSDILPNGNPISFNAISRLSTARNSMPLNSIMSISMRSVVSRSSRLSMSSSGSWCSKKAPCSRFTPTMPIASC